MQVSTNPQNGMTQQVVQQAPQVQLNPGTSAQNTVPYYYPQTCPIPASSSGVNIQIFNPAVCAPGAQGPNYNTNAPCYPAGYYTSTLGEDGRLYPNNSTTNNNSTNPTNSNQPTKNNSELDNNSANTTGNTQSTGNNSGTNNTPTNATDNTQSGENNSGVNNTNNQNNQNNNTNNTDNNGKKTEKRKIVQLNDNYIKSLENMLNSQESETRLTAAKDVYDRLSEDDSRYNDAALNALINKMLQDPKEEIRLLALSALEERIVSGDDYTVNLLQKMQHSGEANGQDAIEATNALLKMQAKQVEKEFEVTDKPKKTEDSK